MGRVVCMLGDRFFEFSTIVEAPVTGLMTEDEFVEFSTKLYGELYRDNELPGRLDRARKYGHSYMITDAETLEDFLRSHTLNTYRAPDHFTDEEVDEWDGFPGMEAFIAEYFLDAAESVDGSPGIVMPGDRTIGERK